MTDKEVLDILVKDGNLVASRLTLTYLQHNPELKSYLDSRYEDSQSYRETLFRIAFHIEERPVCKICGKPVNFKSFKEGFYEYCSVKCCKNDPEIKERTKQTNLERYGCENVWSSEEIRDRVKKTNLERYGSEYPAQSEAIKEKMKKTCQEKYGCDFVLQADGFKEQAKKSKLERYGDAFYTNRDKSASTCLERYGEDNAAKSKHVKEQIKQTNIERYGYESPMKNQEVRRKYVETCFERYGEDNPIKAEEVKHRLIQTNLEKYGEVCPLVNEEIRDKSIRTCLEKYGETSYMKTDEAKKRISEILSSEEVQAKINETKRKRGHFNSSKVEEQFRDYLEENYKDDYIYQYRSDKYPFNCDFYIKSKDLYIEIQGHWSHGGKPFENSREDQETIQKWKQKNSKFYDIAIETWTIRDVKKREFAKCNGLKYLEIFSHKINDVIEAFESAIKF